MQSALYIILAGRPFRKSLEPGEHDTDSLVMQSALYIILARETLSQQ